LEAQVADLTDELDGYRSAASEMAAELEAKTQEVRHCKFQPVDTRVETQLKAPGVYIDTNI